MINLRGKTYYPDGAVAGSAGAIWLACWEGSRVQRNSPDGVLLVEHLMPASRITRPAAG